MRTPSFPALPAQPWDHRPIIAKQVFARLPGGSASLLMLDVAGKAWVVKFEDNPQHQRVIVNEYLATRIAQDLGFTVPNCRSIFVDPSVLECLPQHVRAGAVGTNQKSNIHFASEFVGGLFPGVTLDELPTGVRCDVVNVSELPGMLAFDTWVCNIDRRQNVFVRQSGKNRYKAVWIDNGHCFGAGSWRLRPSIEDSMVGSSPDARSLDFANFSPWLERIECFPSVRLETITAEMPPEWLRNQQRHLSFLFGQLISRQPAIRKLIHRGVEFKDLVRFTSQQLKWPYTVPLGKATRTVYVPETSGQIRWAEGSHKHPPQMLQG